MSDYIVCPKSKNQARKSISVCNECRYHKKCFSYINHTNQTNPTTPEGKEHTMSIKDLATEYNSLLKKHSIDKPGVKKFSSLAAGEKRLAQLKEEIADLAEVKPVEVKVVLPSPKADKKADKKAEKSATPKTTPSSEKFRPAVEGQRMKYKLFLINSNTTRKEYIEACMAIGIKKSTAGQQWGFTMEELEKKFGGAA